MTAAAALFLALVGFVVFLARPRARLNRTLGALLVLRGAADLMYHLMRTASSAEEATMYVRVANWYEAPVTLLTLLFLDDLHPDGSSRRRRALALAAGALVALMALPATPWYDGLFNVGIRATDDAFYGRPGVLTPVFNAATWTAEALALATAARAAASPRLDARRRTQAALLGLAFALPLLHNGARRAASTLWLLAAGKPEEALHGGSPGGPALPALVLAAALLA
ncbi:MAG TPA: hypothetical protein VHH36_01200, partial [Candidatus Thermoplasmatota archaeon]|nr:hypothetical protein [Candidatus Thermoplasmatota archaeon]